MKTACPHCDARFDFPSLSDSTHIACPFCRETFAVDLAEVRETGPVRSARRRTRSCPMCGAENSAGAIKCHACGEAFERRSESASKPHSGLGIASFAIVMLAGIVIFTSFIAAGILGAEAQDDLDGQGMAIMLVGLGIIGGMMLDVIGTVLGIAALFFPDQNKLFAVLGTVLGALLFLGVAGLLGIGIAMQLAANGG